MTACAGAGGDQARLADLDRRPAFRRRRLAAGAARGCCPRTPGSRRCAGTGGSATSAPSGSRTAPACRPAPTCLPCPRSRNSKFSRSSMPSRPTTWKRTSLLGRLGAGSSEVIHMWAMMPPSNTICAITLWAAAAMSLKVSTWAKTCTRVRPGQPAQEVGVVRGHPHEQPAAARVEHPLPVVEQLAWSAAMRKAPRRCASSGPGRCTPSSMSCFAFRVILRNRSVLHDGEVHLRRRRRRRSSRRIRRRSGPSASRRARACRPRPPARVSSSRSWSGVASTTAWTSSRASSASTDRLAGDAVVGGELRRPAYRR